MKVLSVENISKNYGDKALFKSIHFSISEKEKIGLIGINGTGKSTLLKIIARLDSADNGTINHPHDYKIEYLSQDPVFKENTTILEHVFYGDSPVMRLFKRYETTLTKLEKDPMDENLQKNLFLLQQEMDALQAWEANTLAKTILNRLGIKNYERNISSLSGGEKKRVALAQVLIQPADLLILDEPTNHIDNETIEWLEDFLAKYSGSILLVTHDRYFLNHVTNNILELENSNILNFRRLK